MDGLISRRRMLYLLVGLAGAVWNPLLACGETNVNLATKTGGRSYSEISYISTEWTNDGLLLIISYNGHAVLEIKDNAYDQEQSPGRSVMNIPPQLLKNLEQKILALPFDPKQEPHDQGRYLDTIILKQQNSNILTQPRPDSQRPELLRLYREAQQILLQAADNVKLNGKSFFFRLSFSSPLYSVDGKIAFTVKLSNIGSDSIVIENPFLNDDTIIFWLGTRNSQDKYVSYDFKLKDLELLAIHGGAVDAKEWTIAGNSAVQAECKSRTSVQKVAYYFGAGWRVYLPGKDRLEANYFVKSAKREVNF